MWRNSERQFGRVTRTLHWLMAIAILGMLALGSTIAGMEVNLSNLWLFGLHKTIGICLLALAVLRILWHRVSAPPPLLSGPPPWQMAAARWTHRAFYLLMLAVPLSGWAASGATGLDVVIFDRWVLPPLAPVSEAWESALFGLHAALTTLLLGLIALHAAGALKRHVFDRDETLARMLTGSGRRD